MCDICWQTPCHNRCPNTDVHYVCKCVNCGNEIYDGDVCYDINGEIWCEDCITDCRTFASEDIL